MRCQSLTKAARFVAPGMIVTGSSSDAAWITQLWLDFFVLSGRDSHHIKK